MMLRFTLQQPTHSTKVPAIMRDSSSRHLRAQHIAQGALERNATPTNVARLVCHWRKYVKVKLAKRTWMKPLDLKQTLAILAW